MASEKHVGSPQTSDSADCIPGFKDVTEYSQHTLKAVLQATKCSNELPAAGNDFDYYSSYQSFQDVVDVEGKRILHVIQSVLKHQNVRGNISKSTDLEVEDKFDILIDANDQILERAGNWLDEASGVKKDHALVLATGTPKQSPLASWNKKTPQSDSKISKYRLLSARNILRPQLKFKDKIDNSNKPFIPKITHKPNALKSLHESMMLPANIDVNTLNDPDFVYPHPYQFEIDNWQPPAHLLTPVKPQEAQPFDTTAFTMISTVSDLAELCDTLKDEKEIAVDLEHHSYRTFLGITCLMQLSTRSQDYIIDAIELRSDMYLLNEIFTDPKIVKVFHGSDQDIVWLQRDFGLYIVNMFDTGQASRVLSLSRFSLAHLLQTYCQVKADKQYQLADWRIRPLPEELLKYGREDTHYLLYIYDRMKNDLINTGNEQRNLLLSVFQRSKELCMKVCKKPVFNDEIHLELYKKSKKIFNSQQLMALKNLYAWRDRTAREQDESLGFVLPNHMLLQIAEVLPREKQGVFACCNPIPPMVRQCLNEIHEIIMEARDCPIYQVQMPSRFKPTMQHHPKYDPDNLLHCSHDLSHTGDRPTDIAKPDNKLVAETSTMFAPKLLPVIPTKTKPLLSAFAHKSTNQMKTAAEKKALSVRATFISPFEKYLPDVVAPKVPSATDLKSLPGSPRKFISDEEKTQTIKGAWMLKKNTEISDLPDASVSEPDVLPSEPTPVFVQPSKKPKIEENDVLEENDMSLREQIKVDKKKNSNTNTNAETPEKKVKKKKKRKSEHLDNSTESGEFTPYDYSKADMSVFEKSGKKKKTVYDPAAEMLNLKNPKVSKPNYPPSKHSKSYTYGKKDKPKCKGRYWPK